MRQLRINRAYYVYLIQAAILFVLYFATAKIGLGLDPVSDFATLVWPPTGIALVAIFLFGYRLWPAVALAAFTVNFITGAPLLVSLGIATGNTLEALLGVYLLKRFTNFQPSLERISDIFYLVTMAALASTAVSATIGTSSLLFGGIIDTSAYGRTWIAWWIGDMLGDIVIAPLLLVWSIRPRFSVRPRKIAEALVLAILVIVIGTLIFRGFPAFGIQSFRFTYLIFPIVIWIAIRFGQRAGVIATFAVSIIAVWATVRGYGPFAGDRLSSSLLQLQGFIAITAVTVMAMAAVVAEQKNTEKTQLRLAQRTKLLTQRHSQLKSLNKSKDEFVAIASHQLRTPSTAIRQYLGLLLEGYAGPLPQDQMFFLKRAYESNERQLQIVDDILRVAQLDLDKMKLRIEPHDTKVIVDKAITGLSRVFELKKQNVNFIKPRQSVTARVDNTQFRTVIDNLLENASNYSPEKAKITVEIKKTKTTVYVTIADEGIGIAHKDFPKLFQKFSRISNDRSTDVNGSGLGLYLSYKIIKLHGGEITVQSQPGRGSTFTVILPR